MTSALGLSWVLIVVLPCRYRCWCPRRRSRCPGRMRSGSSPIRSRLAAQIARQRWSGSAAADVASAMDHSDSPGRTTWTRGCDAGRVGTARASLAATLRSGSERPARIEEPSPAASAGEAVPARAAAPQARRTSRRVAPPPVRRRPVSSSATVTVVTTHSQTRASRSAVAQAATSRSVNCAAPAPGRTAVQVSGASQAPVAAVAVTTSQTARLRQTRVLSPRDTITNLSFACVCLSQRLVGDGCQRFFHSQLRVDGSGFARTTSGTWSGCTPSTDDRWVPINPRSPDDTEVPDPTRDGHAAGSEPAGRDAQRSGSQLAARRTPSVRPSQRPRRARSTTPSRPSCSSTERSPTPAVGATSRLA